MPRPLDQRHLLGLEGLPVRALRAILDRAHAHADDISSGSVEPTLTGRFVCPLFLEDSTRTRVSFETAATRLGAELIRFDARTSSLSKGESLIDTAETLVAGGAECLILRHASSGAPAHLDRALEKSGRAVPIINAGDGMHEHPTQALLDVYTIERRLGSIEGAVVAIVGDARHSRVARSLVYALRTLGATVRLVGPRTFVTDELRAALDVRAHRDFDEGLDGADVAYFLRIQSERQGAAAYLPTSAYRALYGAGRTIPKDAIIMHPGPVNRGVELDTRALNDPRCAVLDQVAHGVPIRMAVLERALLDEWGEA